MIALRTIIYFLATSLISAIIGLVLVLAIHPGNAETKAELGDGTTETRNIDIVDNFMDLGRNLFPDNLFQASFQTVIEFIQRKLSIQEMKVFLFSRPILHTMRTRNTWPTDPAPTPWVSFSFA